MSEQNTTELRYVFETIGDPRDYLQANTDIASSDNNSTSIIVAGKDIDILLTPIEGEPLTIGRTDSITSNVFGGLYREGKLFGELIGHRFFDVEWLPSADYTNELARQLGLTPGKEVFEIRRAPGLGKIPPEQFCQFAANYILPQSTDKELFRHDRSDDHIVGALFMPPHVTANIAAFAQKTLDIEGKKSFKKRFFTTNIDYKSPVEKAAHVFDRTTAAVTEIVDALVETGNIDTAIQKLTSENGPMNISKYLVETCPSEGWLTDGKLPKELRPRVRFMAEVLMDRLATIMPRLTELKASATTIFVQQ